MKRGAKIISVLVLWVWCVSTVDAQVAGSRRIPDDNLSYPVLIKINGSDTGSAFYLNSGRNLFLVTAKHVLFRSDDKTLLGTQAEALSYARDPNERTSAVFGLDLRLLNENGNLKTHATQDVLVVRIGTVAGEPGDLRSTPESGVEVKSAPNSGFVSAGIGTVKRFADVLVSNEVIVFGYPSSIGIPNVPQIDYSRPLLRKGIVAGTNDTFKSIVLDCPVYPGNSGGPVVELAQDGLATRLRIIGVVIQYVPFAQNSTPGSQNLVIGNSGYAIAAAMDSVLDLISGFD